MAAEPLVGFYGPTTVPHLYITLQNPGCGEHNEQSIGQLKSGASGALKFLHSCFRKVFKMLLEQLLSPWRFNSSCNLFPFCKQLM